jgi:surface antigen
VRQPGLLPSLPRLHHRIPATWLPSRDIRSAALLDAATTSVHGVSDVYECTSYVAYRLNRADGALAFSDSYKGVRWGNAGNWISAAKAAGVHSGTKPEIGSVAVWADASGLLSQGHVAFVTSVSNGVATLAEYNARYYYPAYNPPGYDTSKSSSNPSGKPPTEYLYFPGVASTSDNLSFVNLDYYTGNAQVVTYSASSNYQTLIQNDVTGYPATTPNDGIIPLYQP